MPNPNEPKLLMKGKITFDVGASTLVILQDGRKFIAAGFSSNPNGIYVIGAWDKDSLHSNSVAIDGTSKMLLIPWHEIEQVIHDIERSTSDDEPQEEKPKVG